jgi:putative transposase
MPYLKIYLHIIWATKNRQPSITQQAEPLLYTYLRTVCEPLRVKVLAINGMPDHVHMLVGMPATLGVGALLNRLKGGSSYYMRQEHSFDIRWQKEYAAFSVSEKLLERVIGYIENQKIHHSQGSTIAEYEPDVF